MRSIVRGLALFIASGAVLGGAAAGTSVPTLRVPEDFASIQAAVDSLGRGGIVEVGAGTYGPVRLGTDVESGISIVNVTIRGATDAVIDGRAEPAISVLSARDVVVDGFTVVSQDAGVSVSHGENVEVRNVTVAAAGTDGIRVEAVTDVSVTGNRIESAGGTGISVNAGTAETYGPLVVRDNTVVSAGGDAILVHNIGDGAKVVVSGNTVESATGRGIRTECGMTLQLSHNDVHSTGGAGISVDRVVDTTNVTQNTVTDAGGAGVEFTYGVSVVIANNRIDGTAGDGVAGSLAASAEIRANSVTDAGDAGVRIVNIDPVTVASNEVVDPTGTGIVLEEVNRGAVQGNTVAEPGVHGVELDATDRVRVIGNVVTGAEDCGFRLENGAGGNVLKRNKALECAQGLWVEDGLRKRNRIARSNRFGRRHAPR